MHVKSYLLSLDTTFSTGGIELILHARESLLDDRTVPTSCIRTCRSIVTRSNTEEGSRHRYTGTTTMPRDSAVWDTCPHRFSNAVAIYM